MMYFLIHLPQACITPIFTIYIYICYYQGIKNVAVLPNTVHFGVYDALLMVAKTKLLSVNSFLFFKK
jgi:hypothetical protein